MPQSDLGFLFSKWTSVLPGPETSGYIQCQNQKEAGPCVHLEASCCCLEGMLSPVKSATFITSILFSGDTYVPVGPLISNPCYQQHLPQS